MYKPFFNELNRLEESFNVRRIADIEKEGKYVILNDKKYLNLSSNDYLGLAENKDIINDFLKDNKYSFGSASSRLLTGTTRVYNELEELLSNLYQKDNALLFNSGYHANVGIMSSLLAKKDVVFSDKLNHASIIDGMKLSDSTFYRYKHLDYEHLESLLIKYREKYETAIIVTESIFSMDGDCADLNKLVELKKKYNAILLVDEAHAFGVYGENALGLCEQQNCIKDIDLIIATFGKAIASMGAFCVGNNVLINYLINKARSFIFSTALPEINVAFSKYVITNIIPNSKELRSNLFKTVNYLREQIKLEDLKTLGESHIVPVIIGENNKTLDISKKLLANNFYVLPIRHPTVPVNSARLRLSLRADITVKDIESIPNLIRIAQNKVGK